MSLIQILNLTFGYEGSVENIFKNVSFQIDTDWKLGFVGRNGRGKTTFLNLCLNKFEYSGTITASVCFDYFPFQVEEVGRSTREIVRECIAPFGQWEKEMEECLGADTEISLARYSELQEAFAAADGYMIDGLIEREIATLDLSPGVLDRPFTTLSSGERTKVLLTGLFLKKNNFLLIDEPTNHLDLEGRRAVASYLQSKKGFILVSHDREFLDGIIDHILVINKANIEVQKGNFTSWQLNKDRQDTYELLQNERLKKDIRRLTAAAKRASDWSDETEASKIGMHAFDRGAIGHKAAKMMKRSKSIEQRRQNAVESKTKLLKNIEQADALSLKPLEYHRDRLVEVRDLALIYDGRRVAENINFVVNARDRVTISGKNGSGKSSLLKLLTGENISYSGSFSVGIGLQISYIPQDTSFLKGSIKDFVQCQGLDESLFKSILRKLDFSREQFEKDMRDFSAGQQKKVLLAKSLSQPGHLYIWDEPLNFVDVLSRIQIEELILNYNPTMIFVEHDALFCQNIATVTVML